VSNTVQRIVLISNDDILHETATDLATEKSCQVESFRGALPFFESFVPLADDGENCVILDVTGPDVDAVDFIQQTIERRVPRPVVVFAQILTPSLVSTAMRAGAVNCVEKPITTELLYETIRDAFLWTESVRQVHEAYDYHERYQRLTDLEKRIVNRAAEGMPNKRIARELDRSMNTVEKYRSSAYEKLGVVNTASMARALTLQSMYRLRGPFVRYWRS